MIEGATHARSRNEVRPSTLINIDSYIIRSLNPPPPLLPQEPAAIEKGVTETGPGEKEVKAKAIKAMSDEEILRLVMAGEL